MNRGEICMFVGYCPSNPSGTYCFIKVSNKQLIVTRNYRWINGDMDKNISSKIKSYITNPTPIIPINIENVDNVDIPYNDQNNDDVVEIDVD